MDARKRVESAIGHRVADRVPRGEIFIDDGVIKSFLKCREVAFEQRREFVLRLGLDIICLTPCFSSVRRAGLPPAESVCWPDLDRWVRETDRFVFAMVDGAFGWGMKLFGFEGFFAMLARDTGDLTDFLLQVEGFNITMADRAIKGGAAAILIADDIACSLGMMVDPGTLRKHYFPSLARQVSSFDVPVFFHSDGNLSLVLGDIVGAGFLGLQGIEAAAGMDIGRVKGRYGKRLCLWGNLDPSGLVGPCDGQQLRNDVRSIVSAASDGGGFIFGTSSGLFNGMRPENLLAVYGEEGCFKG